MVFLNIFEMELGTSFVNDRTTETVLDSLVSNFSREVRLTRCIRNVDDK